MFALRIVYFADRFDLDGESVYYFGRPTAKAKDEKDILLTCLEEYLNNAEGQLNFPPNPKEEIWEFVEGNSKEDIKNDNCKVIRKFLFHTKDGLWDFFNLVKESRIKFSLKTEY